MAFLAILLLSKDPSRASGSFSADPDSVNAYVQQMRMNACLYSPDSCRMWIKELTEGRVAGRIYFWEFPYGVGCRRTVGLSLLGQGCGTACRSFSVLLDLGSPVRKVRNQFGTRSEKDLSWKKLATHQYGWYGKFGPVRKLVFHTSTSTEIQFFHTNRAEGMLHPICQCFEMLCCSL